MDKAGSCNQAFSNYRQSKVCYDRQQEHGIIWCNNMCVFLCVNFSHYTVMDQHTSVFFHLFKLQLQGDGGCLQEQHADSILGHPSWAVYSNPRPSYFEVLMLTSTFAPKKTNKKRKRFLGHYKLNPACRGNKEPLKECIIILKNNQFLMMNSVYV